MSERCDPGRLPAEQLLGRPEVELPLERAVAALRGRRVLVTGAGGSVGSALAARLLALEPAALLLLDSHEASLFQLQRHLRPARPTPTLLLGDVRNRAKLQTVFHQHQPEIVFHLAAYKHVHFGETQPDESIAVNVLATDALAELAAQHDVVALVYTSSDKAVQPSGAYGATKRLAELVVQARGRRARGRFVVVRFVNVLGTRGSVIETWCEQLAAGQPVTITDPAMTRYWMSMAEATALLLAAAGLGDNGSILLLDVGAPVPVVTLAERLCALLGRGAPALEVVGRRPGERLAEALVSPHERLVPGPLPQTWRVARDDAEAPLRALPAALAALRGALDATGPELASRLVALARELP
ncbi:MAG: polysaccharide biosynthesis protein [Chloroflexi bacterium]|nr:polysaccharide biosynthesis protein [Chloroflexota bacterium]